jgi:hypothetical protein
MSRPKPSSKPSPRIAALAETLTAQDMAEALRPAVAKARAGDNEALKIVERHWRLSDRPVELDLPPITDAKSVADAQAHVIELLATKRLGPRTALACSTIFEYRRRALETLDLETTLSELEANQARMDEEFRRRR